MFDMHEEKLSYANLHSHDPSSNRTLELGQVQVNPTGLLLVNRQMWHGDLAQAERPDGKIHSNVSDKIIQILIRTGGSLDTAYLEVAAAHDKL